MIDADCTSDRQRRIDDELAALGEPTCSSDEREELQSISSEGRSDRDIDAVHAMFALAHGADSAGEGSSAPTLHPIDQRRVWRKITARVDARERPGVMTSRPWGWLGAAVAASLLLALVAQPRSKRPGLATEPSSEALQALGRQAHLAVEQLEAPRGEARARALARALAARLGTTERDSNAAGGRG